MLVHQLLLRSKFIHFIRELRLPFFLCVYLLKPVVTLDLLKLLEIILQQTKRFETEVAKNQQLLKDKGYTPTQSGPFNPFSGGPGSAVAEAVWAAKDNEKYPEGNNSFAPAPPSINNDLSGDNDLSGGGGGRDEKLDSKII